MEDIVELRAKRARIDSIVNSRLNDGNFRHEVAQFVPAGTRNILDYGFGDGSLLLWLRRERNCNGLYGVEVNPSAVNAVDGLYDKAWLIDLNKPEANLEPEFDGFFSYILMPMSLEHTYDPWYVLKKMNRYLKPGGSVIVEVPNAQHWDCIYRLFTGDFPYSSGGMWDFTHIRWYTLKSLADIGHVCGFKISKYDLLFPNQIDFEEFNAKTSITTLELPPPEIESSCPKFSITCPVDIKAIYPLLLAHVLIVQLDKVREPEDFDPTVTDGYLESYRLSFQNPVAALSETIQMPISAPLVPRVKARVEELIRRQVF